MIPEPECRETIEGAIITAAFTVIILAGMASLHIAILMLRRIIA